MPVAKKKTRKTPRKEKPSLLDKLFGPRKQEGDIVLKERAERLRQAECVAKGGTYRGGKCMKN